MKRPAAKRPAAKKRRGAMLPRERTAFSAIADRSPLKLPNNKRLIFWSFVNLEVWDIGKPMARQVLAPPTGVTHLPDVPNWSWHEYGMRVGVWRFFELFERQNIRPTLARITRASPKKRKTTLGNSWAIPISRGLSISSQIRGR